MSLKDRLKKGPDKRPPRLMLMGVPGIGKTTAGLAFPNPVYLMSDRGLIGEDFENADQTRVTTWEDALATLHDYAEDDHNFKTLIIDTTDSLELLMIKYITEHYKDIKTGKKLEVLSDYLFGRGSDIAVREMSRFLVGLERIIAKKKMIILFLTHIHVKPFSNPEGPDYSRYEPKLDKKVAGLISEWVDTVLFAKYTVHIEEGQGIAKNKAFSAGDRVIRTSYAAGHHGKNGYNLPEEMPFTKETGMKDVLTKIFEYIKVKGEKK